MGLGEKDLNRLNISNVCSRLRDGEHISFGFVGVVTIKEFVLVILPKFCTDIKVDMEKYRMIRLVLKVLERYSLSLDRRYEGDAFFLTRDIDDSEISEISLADYLLRDYVFHGIYRRENRDSLLNGTDHIDWLRTITDVIPIITEYGPVYHEHYSDLYEYEDLNLISSLHRSCLRRCSIKFGPLLEYDDISDYIPSNPLEPIEKTTEDHMLSVLQRELNQTYIIRNIRLLKALYTMISREFSPNTDNFSLYGTRNFNLVWEKVCSDTLGNFYHTLKNEIPKPQWIDLSGLIIEKSTLKPDILMEISSSEKKIFLIMDAKYYNLKFSAEGGLLKVENNPGIADVIKQFAYERVFQEKENKLNLFLFPENDSEKLLDMVGMVSMPFMSPNPIGVVYVDAKKVFDMYIKGEIIMRERLENFIVEIFPKLKR